MLERKISIMNDDPAALSSEFRIAMRGVPSPVVIVTAQDAGDQYAVTLSSMISLSLEPASLLISVNRSSSLYGALERGAGFCVNVLRKEHQRLAEICSNPRLREERYRCAEFGTHDAIPYFRAAQANIFCVQNGRYLYATHAIIIGKATSVQLNGPLDPLVYLDGRFGEFADGTTF